MSDLLKPVPAMVSDALRAAEVAQKVIVEFRQFARDPRAAEDADVSRAVRQALAALRERLRGIRVVRELAQLPPVRCIPGQIQHAVMNLIKNAAEAMDGRGTLTVRTRRRSGAVEIMISDTGRGIPASERPHVFEPFYTTKAEGSGMGLGLPITATIIQNHGGRVTLSSREGRGTRATILLPRRGRG
jgi:two-component system NtrC family sensor kinase